MSILLENSNTVVVDERLQSESNQFLDMVADRDPGTIVLELEDGERLQLTQGLARFIFQTLQGLTRGPMSITTLPDSLTSSTAAELLGISRPTLMKWVDEGRITTTKVGTHHRFNVADVLKLRNAMTIERRVAFERLRAVDEEFEDFT